MSITAGLRRRVAAAVFAALSTVAGSGGSPARADNWPGFRGGDGRSVSPDKNLPTEWAPDKNVRWRVPLPGRSNGSPIVWGDRVFVLQGLEKEKRRTVMCFSRADGRLLWQSGVDYSEKESTHPDNPSCSGTPATDGERVVACFGSAGLVCFDMAGKELWRRDLGKLDHMFGNAISPVIVGNLVVLNFGPGEGARLVAVDKQTGEIAWDAQPPKVDPSEQRLTAPRLTGPAMVIASQVVTAGDKDSDSLVSREELAALADTWFEKLDAENSAKVSKEQFPERLNQLVPRPPGPGVPKDFDVGKMVGPALFAAADADKDSALTRKELKKTFDAWYDRWDGGKSEPLDLNQLLDGFAAILPPPQGGGRPGAGMGTAKGPGGSWSTPIVVRSGDREEVVVSFPNRLASYDAKAGKLLWFSRELADAVQPSPLWDPEQGAVIAFSGDMAGGQMLAVQLGGSGDVTNSHRLWRQPRVKGSIGTGVVHNDRLYAISGDGFALCVNAMTGRKLWQKRLEGSGDRGSSWSSMLLAGDRIYVPNQSGDVFVLKASDEFELLATNSVGEPTNASLAASDGQLFLRTDKSLWCIGGGK